MSKVKECTEQLASIKQQIASVMAQAKNQEKQLLTKEQRETVDKMYADYDRIKDELQSHERMEKFEAALLDDARTPSATIQTYNTGGEDFVRWVKAKAGLINRNDMTYEDHSNVFRSVPSNSRRKNWMERANEPQTFSLNSGNYGADLVPITLADFVSRFKSAVWDVRTICRNIVTEGVGKFDVPTINDVSNEAALIAETTADTVTPVAVSEVELKAYCYTSNLLLISKEMLKSSAFDAISFFAEDLAGRMNRGRAHSLCTGAGSGSAPEGYVTGSTNEGLELASNTAITFAELQTWYHSLPIAYRANASWVLSDSLAQIIRSLVDSAGRPVWSLNPYPSAAYPFADTLFGRPVYIDPYMPATTDTPEKTVGVFGDFSNFLVRSAGGVEAAVSDQRYFEQRAVALVSYAWWDSKVMQAGAFRTCSTS